MFRVFPLPSKKLWKKFHFFNYFSKLSRVTHQQIKKTKIDFAWLTKYNKTKLDQKQNASVFTELRVLIKKLLIHLSYFNRHTALNTFPLVTRCSWKNSSKRHRSLFMRVRTCISRTIWKWAVMPSLKVVFPRLRFMF